MTHLATSHRWPRIFDSSRTSPVANLAAVALLAIAFAIGGLGSNTLNAQNDSAAPTTAEPAQENSMRKIRVRPNAQSKRIGTAVNWAESFDDAVAKSKASGKPIFWYVPRLARTFMDRKIEIDRYMMAGPFSWPEVIDVLNEHYIPVKAVPRGNQQKEYGLELFKFVEPGFVILDSNLQLLSKVDRITTFQYDWLRGLIVAPVADKQPVAPVAKPPALQAAWDSFAAGENRRTIELLTQASGEIAKLTPRFRCEAGLLQGMATFHQGDHQAAAQIWAQVATDFPEEPLAWKASAESQRIGPFSRGFEVHIPLTEKALRSGIDTFGSNAPEGTFTKSQLWRRGVDFLLSQQGRDGSFRDSDYDFGGTDSLPNVYVAVTSLAGMALLDALEQDEFDDASKTRLAESISRAAKYVSDDTNINRADRDEILWAYAYRLRFLADCITHNRSTGQTTKLSLPEAELTESLQRAVTSLESVQSQRGSWYHEYANPFVTATALAALRIGQETGANVNNKKVQAGVKALAADRFANGAFPYGSGGRKDEAAEGTERDINAAAGRMPLCELGLWYWDSSDDEKLAAAVVNSIKLQANLDAAYKYDNHTSRYAYGGFFFWYDMRSRSEAISKIASDDLRRDLAAQHTAIIMKLPELDGCFVDSHELGRVYGTAMALMSLKLCE